MHNFYLRLNKELTYDPYDEGVAGEGDEGEDGVDDAEEDDDGGVVRLVLADLVDHAEGHGVVVGWSLLLVYENVRKGQLSWSVSSFDFRTNWLHPVVHENGNLRCKIPLIKMLTAN